MDLEGYSRKITVCARSAAKKNVPYKETWHLRKQSREIPTFLRLLVDENVNSQDLIKRFDWLTDESRSRLETSCVCL